MCPSAAPSDGAPCDACDELLGCSYGSCQTTGSGISATCVGKQWQLVYESCPVPPPCGPGSEPCPPGALCVQFGGFGDPPKCLPNPCAPGEPVTCECAGGLCTYGYCAEANAQSVICECPNC
jgi:hypothetical protein